MGSGKDVTLRRLPGQGPGLASGVLISVLVLATIAPHSAGPLPRASVGRGKTIAAPRALAASPKPDWRGADPGNSGQEAVSGPVVTPTAVFTASGFPDAPQGLELAADGSVLFTQATGQVYAYRPDGTQKWAFDTNGDSFNSDGQSSPSNPVASSDGHDYVGDDQGKLWRIDDTSGAGSALLDLGGAGIAQTVKVGPDGTLYFGAQDGSINHVATDGTVLYQTFATGSVQTSGYYAGKRSKAPFYFYGEPALDASGNLYIASSDTNPIAEGPRLGTLYKVDAGGNIAWTAPLHLDELGAVVATTNPLTPSDGMVLVADQFGEVAAFDAATGGAMWTSKPAQGIKFVASPAVDVARGVVYVANNADSLYAISLADGSAASGFNGGQPVHVQGGTAVSPLVDGSGDVYVLGSTGTLYGFGPDGSALFALQTGVGAGGYLSPALGADGTLYVAGNNGIVAGFRRGGPAPTATATGTAFPTSSPTPTGTGTPPTSAPTGTASPSATPTQTPVPPTHTSTSTATTTPTSTGTPASSPTATGTPATATGSPTASPTVGTGPATGWAKFRRDAHNDGQAGVPLQLNAPPGIAYAKQVTGGYLASSPVLGPNDTLYQVDDQGRLHAFRASSGQALWTSQAVLGTDASDAGYPASFVVSYQTSSPAVGADGTIYAVSEANYGTAQAGGIWKFDPTTGNATEILDKGWYLGSSPVIGPDGTIYAGSVDGTVYAVKPNGTLVYQAAVPANGCGGGQSPLIQGSPALDSGGNLYIGYGCSGDIKNGLHGGVMKVSPSGQVLWTARSPATVTGPNSTTPGGEVLTAVVLSADGNTLYATDNQAHVFALQTGSGAQEWSFSVSTSKLTVGSPALSPDGGTLYVPFLPSSSGQVSALYALSTASGQVLGQAGNSEIDASPAVDANGNVLVATTTGALIAYSANLQGQLFGQGYSNQALLGGPTVGADGTIYLSGSSGQLFALKAGVAVPTATSTAVVVQHTVLPGATFTSQPTIPLGTATPTVRATGTITTVVGTATPVTNTGPGTGKGGKSFTLSVDSSYFKPNYRLTVRTRTQPKAQVAYTLKVTFTYPAAPKKTTTKKPASHKKTGKTGKKSTKTGSTKGSKGASTSGDTQAQADGPSPHLLLAKATPTPKAKTKTKPKPTTKGKKPAAGAKAPACAATISDRGTFHFTRRADAHGNDSFCLQIGRAPPRATGLKLTFSATVTAGKKKFTPKAVSLSLPRRFPILTLKKVSVHLGKGTLHSGDTLTADVVAASNASLTYVVSFGKGAPVQRGKTTADSDGYQTLRLRITFKPPKGKRVTATLAITATKGRAHASVTARFTLTR